MTRADEYRRRAEEVEKLVAKTPPGSERDGLLRIAEQWRQLAKDAERER
jgi:hypothetical protein